MNPLTENAEGVTIAMSGHAVYSGSYRVQVFTRTIIAMFYIIGLGLADEKDITIKGLEVT